MLLAVIVSPIARRSRRLQLCDSPLSAVQTAPEGRMEEISAQPDVGNAQ